MNRDLPASNRIASVSGSTVSRRTALIGAAGLASAGLVGCGRDADPGKGSSAPASPIADGKATGELTIWAMGAEGEKLGELTKAFSKENPDVTVNVTAIPWDAAHDKFTSSIAAGTTPDAAMIGTTWMGEFVDLDALDPTPADLFDPSAFFAGAWGTSEVQGVSYAVPWYTETRMLYVRTDLAEKTGITEAGDWESLKQLSAAMQEQKGVKWGIGLQPGQEGSWQQVMPFAWSNGAAFTNEAEDQFTFDTPEMTEALAYYQSYFVDGIANKSQPVDGDAIADFVNGTVPMFFSGPWMISLINETGGKGFSDKYQVWPVPMRKTATSFVGGANFGVFKATKNRDAAWKLIEFLMKPKVQVEWFSLSANLPSVQSAFGDEALAADQRLSAFGKQLDDALAPPALPTWAQISAKFDAQIERVCKQGTDPAKALATVQAEATSIGTGQ